MDLQALKDKLDTARNSFDYRLEKVLFDVAEQMCGLMDNQHVSRADLANRMQVSPAYITKILNGYPNLTIKSLLKLSDALGQDLSVRFGAKVQIAQSVQTISIPSGSTVQEFVYVRKREAVTVDAETIKTVIDEVPNDLALAA